jgi:hypothetical protein
VAHFVGNILFFLFAFSSCNWPNTLKPSGMLHMSSSASLQDPFKNFHPDDKGRNLPENLVGLTVTQRSNFKEVDRLKILIV